MNTLEIIKREVPLATLEMTNDQVVHILDHAQFVKREVTALVAQLEISILEWIQAHGDLIVSDSIRYYAGTSKTTKCVDLPAAVAALMEATGGNFEKFCEVLSANALKHGAAKKVMDPNVYDLCFKVEIKDTLEEGKPVKKLMKADDAFVR